MKSTQIKTDDLSFGTYLSKIDHNYLLEHVYENILPECVVNFILNKPHIIDECLSLLLEKDISLPPKTKAYLIKDAMEDNEELVRLCIDLLFSKKALIDMLLEYLDEDARIDLIENQTEWEKPNSENINLN
jgi:hypothetical protein